jgi:hypothetical protein
MSQLARPTLVLAALGCAMAIGPQHLEAHHRHTPFRTDLPGHHVSASVEVDGQRAKLYAAPDGSGRYYFEATAGSAYAVRLENRGYERLGIRLSVDGLNVIDGLRVAPGPDPGRMYVLGPRAHVEVRGWRRSLQEVRRFTFVDEERSYASRTGQASGKLGWIELDVYRERQRANLVGQHEDGGLPPELAAADARRGRPPASEPPRSAESAGKRAARDSFPGTGWGASTHDPARVVAFDPDPMPIERGVLRYEYRSGLLALGIRPASAPDAGRLAQRDRGEPAFALPPPD